LSRAFATVEQDRITGERKDLIVDGHKVVAGYNFLAEFEVAKLVEAIDEIIEQKVYNSK